MTQYLYHYTNFDGLKGILDTKELWLTERKCLNDMSEFIYSKDLMIKIISNQLLFEHIVRDLDLTDVQANKVHEFTNQIKNLSLEIWKRILAKMGSAYIFSFCKHEDEKIKKNGLLSMWRAYGQENSYMLEFEDGKLLRRKINKLPCALSKVFYDEYNEITAIDEIIVDTFKEYIGEISKDLLGNSNQNENALVMPKHVNASAFLVGFIKHFGFYEENEYRLLLIDLENKQNILLRKKNQKLIAYTKLPIKNLPKILKRIVIGPQSEQTKQKEYLEKYLKQIGFNDTAVEISNIPYLS